MWYYIVTGKKESPEELENGTGKREPSKEDKIMKNLKKTVSEIKSCPQGMGAYYEVFYNRATDELFTCFQVSLGHNSWTKFENPEIVKIGEFEKPVTMKELKQLVEEAR